ncbi:hypothetical protein [Streptomyces malaysiensis]|uniref:Uncharacterized protein n=1 Tax=Streptomyces malaysiensis subsp. samsunensis TaxID=459658 RepID=A0A9X2LY06_STRMQ|nr:hypothetical protein [Streptomyces samsunensis]MCQ8831827.1 hypothetical protein [Streptomyces samsunensis]
MTAQFDAADIAAMRAEGSLEEFLRLLTGKAAPKPPTVEKPDVVHYVIPRPGAWPIGTAASGPIPAVCDCPNCGQNGADR